MTDGTMTVFITFVVVIGSYLLGSVPTAFLVAKWRRGVDIRQKGSGQVGGSNVWHSVSRRFGVGVAVADVAKGVAVVAVSRLAGLGEGGQVLAGLAAICGHNWSIFLGFGGGRGIAVLGGVILVLVPREMAVFATIGILGVVLRSVPLGVLLGVISLPVTAVLLNESTALTLGLLAMVVVVLLKRVVPRRRWPARWRRVMLYRALFDRDVRSREEWVKGGGGSGHEAEDSGKNQKQTEGGGSGCP